MEYQRSRQLKTVNQHQQQASGPSSNRSTPVHPLLHLQQQIGNRAVTQMIQAKLKVGQPNDKYEQEADRVAAQVMAMPAPTHPQPIQREIDPLEEELQTQPLTPSSTDSVQRAMMPEQEEEIQTKSSPPPTAPAESLEVSQPLAHRLSRSKGAGSPLPDNVRAFMEPRFGADFSQVRVHTDSEAVQMNQELGAQAFTYGSDIYYGAGSSPTISNLTAHELTHVVQQTGVRQTRLSFEASENHQPKGLLVQTELQRDSDSNEPVVQRQSLKEQMFGDFSTARDQLKDSLEDVFEQQKAAIKHFTTNAGKEDSPSITTQILLSGIELLLGAVLGRIAIALKATATRALQPVLVGATRVTMGTAIDSSVVRSNIRSSVNTIIDKITEAGKQKVGDEVKTAWSKVGAAATPLLQFSQTQELALIKIYSAQKEAMNSYLAKLLTTPDTGDEWAVANALYESLKASLKQEYAYNEQYNAMTDTWFTLQVKSVSGGASPGVLQIFLKDRYPHEGSFTVEGGNLVGIGANKTIRDRLASRPLETIAMPKVIHMEGSMGHGILPCIWQIHVTGQKTAPVGRAISSPRTNLAFMAGPQRVVDVRGNPWGLPWLAAFHLKLKDLDSDDPRNTAQNQVAGALAVWEAIKRMSPRSIDNSTW